MMSFQIFLDIIRNFIFTMSCLFKVKENKICNAFTFNYHLLCKKNVYFQNHFELFLVFNYLIITYLVLNYSFHFLKITRLKVIVFKICEFLNFHKNLLPVSTQNTTELRNHVSTQNKCN